MDREKLKAEIERVERAINDKHGQFIRQELKQYLKILKRDLRRAEKE